MAKARLLREVVGMGSLTSHVFISHEVSSAIWKGREFFFGGLTYLFQDFPIERWDDHHQY